MAVKTLSEEYTYFIPHSGVNNDERCSTRGSKPCFFSDERFPVLVDGDTGIPDFAATLYSLTQLRVRNLSASTLTSAVRAIMFGYQALELIDVSLDARLESGRLFELI
jgi:hypothetical protein